MADNMIDMYMVYVNACHADRPSIRPYLNLQAINLRSGKWSTNGMKWEDMIASTISLRVGVHKQALAVINRPRSSICIVKLRKYSALRALNKYVYHLKISYDDVNIFYCGF